jgi:hypothetical protein
MMPPLSTGNVIATDAQAIEVRVAELRQLFNAIDSSPFRERDLDPRAEEFIDVWRRLAFGLAGCPNLRGDSLAATPAHGTWIRDGNLQCRPGTWNTSTRLKRHGKFEKQRSIRPLQSNLVSQLAPRSPIR